MDRAMTAWGAASRKRIEARESVLQASSITSNDYEYGHEGSLKAQGRLLK